ncbi:HTH domain-containing protein [Epidermidibacterium keratini]|uniref:HTH domain-containing protein n=1 Tax=Epidermidibacterium keratini TaxID=1891644 RepID=A0A7L4YKS7_9ACTN|nr:HTH domain-containing protein [Epidermidibacterium keratini]QHB99667.1 HTH domain-containing protein [Epidermidibacterium keratini]
MDAPTGSASAASRDSPLTLRRVERQQLLIERLHAGRGRVTFGQLADELGVAERTIARDIDRLRHSGVPIIVTPGRHGGAAIEHTGAISPVALDAPEIAALLASLSALGPSVSASAASAMHKLTAALRPNSCSR